MSTTQPAGGAADEKVPHNDRSLLSDGTEKAYPNSMNKQADDSSPYGGTQSPDPDAPDGNQNAPRTAPENENLEKKTDLGEEYSDSSSYGEAQSGGKEGDKAKGDDAAGTPVR